VLNALLVAAAIQTLVFSDDFEGSLAKWDLTQPAFVSIVDAAQPGEGRALRLDAGGPGVYALIKGSEAWGSVRMSGMVKFPEDVHNYLGFIWGYLPKNGRTDFGSVYIKGNGSYIRVNPRYDGNPGRAYHEEYRTALEGDEAVVIGRWQPFRIEVDGTTAHLYFGDMSRPKVTYDQYVGQAARGGGCRPPRRHRRGTHRRADISGPAATRDGLRHRRSTHHGLAGTWPNPGSAPRSGSIL